MSKDKSRLLMVQFTPLLIGLDTDLILDALGVNAFTSKILAVVVVLFVYAMAIVFRGLKFEDWLSELKFTTLMVICGALSFTALIFLGVKRNEIVEYNNNSNGK